MTARVGKIRADEIKAGYTIVERAAEHGDEMTRVVEDVGRSAATGQIFIWFEDGSWSDLVETDLVDVVLSDLEGF